VRGFAGKHRGDQKTEASAPTPNQGAKLWEKSRAEISPLA
jgi:hypothetical protein